MRKPVLCFLTLLAFTLPTGAEIYRWVDAQGRVHYSDRPAQGAEKVDGIDSRPTDAAAVAERTEAAAQERAQAEVARREKQTDAAAAQKVEKDTGKLKAERCQKAREDYRVATESQRLYRVRPDGEREYLTAAEITAARVNARKALDEACAGETT